MAFKIVVLKFEKNIIKCQEKRKKINTDCIKSPDKAVRAYRDKVYNFYFFNT